MRDEGFEITAVHYYTGFNGSVGRDIQEGPEVKWTPEQRVVDAAQKLGIRLLPIDMSPEYSDILMNPRYGYGSAANPCIDCRILLLKRAREVMTAENAVFVFTGEVLGQRPMTQFKQTLKLIEKQSGLQGRLLRPLSARCFEPTIPELEGIVNREHLYDIHGRSRKRQMELARSFGIDWYPSSGGGCILTDKSFGKKFHDLVSHAGGRTFTLDDLYSLKTGRHLRLESGVKVIVGRTYVENTYLTKLLAAKHWLFEARDFKGAAVFAFDEPHEEDFYKIAAITARYSKGVHEHSLVVAAQKGNIRREFTVKPAEHKDIEPLLIC